MPDLLEFVRHEPVCKVALFCEGRAEQVLLPAFAFCGDLAGRAVGRGLGGPDAAGHEQGRALSALCERLGITPDECMAFGDYLNDLELLQAAGESYAMANGHERSKRRPSTSAPPTMMTGYAAPSARYSVLTKREPDLYNRKTEKAE